MAKLTLDVVTPYGVTFSDEVDFVSVKGTEGEIGILPNHVPLFTSVKISVLSYKKGNLTDYVAVMGGFLDVSSNNKVTVLSPSAEMADNIDMLRAKQEKEEAETKLLEKAGEVDFARAEKEIEKSLTRLKAIELLEQVGRGRKKL